MRSNERLVGSVQQSRLCAPQLLLREACVGRRRGCRGHVLTALRPASSSSLLCSPVCGVSRVVYALNLARGKRVKDDRVHANAVQVGPARRRRSIEVSVRLESPTRGAAGWRARQRARAPDGVANHEVLPEIGVLAVVKRGDGSAAWHVRGGGRRTPLTPLTQHVVGLGKCVRPTHGFV